MSNLREVDMGSALWLSVTTCLEGIATTNCKKKKTRHFLSSISRDLEDLYAPYLNMKRPSL